MENGTENRDWLVGLELEDEALKADLTLNKYQSLEAALKGHIESSGMNGRSVQIPSMEAGEEAWAKFGDDLVNKVNTNTTRKVMFEPNENDPEQMALYHESIGVPKEVDGYTTPEVEGLNDEAISTAKQFAHKLNMPASMHTKFVELLAEENASVAEGMQQQTADENNRLKTSWGDSTDQRKSRVDSVLRGESLVVENMTTEHYLAYDALISKLQGQGPQGNGLEGIEVGPSISEIKARIADRVERMTSEGRQMGSAQYQSLMDKNARDYETLAEHE